MAGATSVSSTVLLGTPHAALRMREFLTGAQTLVQLPAGSRRPAHVLAGAQLPTDFRESIGFLEAGGLIQRMPDADGGVIHVPPQKRMILDFYKNNTIHFFLLPALLARGLVDGRRGAALKDEVPGGWTCSAGSSRSPSARRCRRARPSAGLLPHPRRPQGGRRCPHPQHPLLRAVTGILDNFQEAYWISARTLGEMNRPLSRKAAIELMRKRYATSLLLGEVRKPEGNSTITLGNALERCREMGVVAMEARSKGRDRMVRPGPLFDQLPILIGRLAPQRRLTDVN